MGLLKKDSTKGTLCALFFIYEAFLIRVKQYSKLWYNYIKVRTIVDRLYLIVV